MKKENLAAILKKHDPATRLMRRRMVMMKSITPMSLTNWLRTVHRNFLIIKEIIREIIVHSWKEQEDTFKTFPLKNLVWQVNARLRLVFISGATQSISSLFFMEAFRFFFITVHSNFPNSNTFFLIQVFTAWRCKKIIKVLKHN